MDRLGDSVKTPYRGEANISRSQTMHHTNGAKRKRIVDPGPGLASWRLFTFSKSIFGENVTNTVHFTHCECLEEARAHVYKRTPACANGTLLPCIYMLLVLPLSLSGLTGKQL